MKGLVLILIAWILFIPFTILNVLIVIFKSVKKSGWKGIKSFNNYFSESAYRFDVFAASEFRTLLNATLISKNSIYKFEKDTKKSISVIIGLNSQTQTLTRLGATIEWLLFMIEKNHCKKYIKPDDYKLNNF